LKGTPIAQGYLSSTPDRTVRVRLYGKEAFLTVKGPSTPDGLSRYEWEIQIPVDQAYYLLDLCEPGMILKNRYIMIHKGKTWEIDVFSGDNTGLVVAEIELVSEDEEFELPNWVTKEITGDVKYYNSNLAKRPFKDWSKNEQVNT
jgi:adenylate cyclase